MIFFGLIKPTFNMLNVGLISPKKIIEECLLFAEQNDIPINSTEGFVRQIIGWRAIQ